MKSTKKKNLVFVIGSLSGGGAERVVSILSNGLVDFYNVSIICIFEDKVEYDINPNINYKFIDLSNQKGIIKKNIKRLVLMSEQIKETNADVIISFLSYVNIFVLISQFFSRKKIIICERNDPNSEITNKFLQKFRNFLFSFRRRNYFVFQTEYVKNMFSKKIKRNSIVIYNPIKSTLPVRNVNSNIKKKIVCVARLDPSKNISLLLKAFSLFIQVKNDYILEIYGKGPLFNELNQLSNELKISEKVFFRGFSSNIFECIEDSEMFVLPSNYEGISNAMLEAMAIGIPVICTDCPAYGARIFIKPGVNGFLTELDNIQMLYEKMLLISENKELQISSIMSAEKLQKQLSEERIVRSWVNFIDKVGDL